MDKSQLNERENKILRLIKKDPFISQQELADDLQLSRPSIANLISGLVRKGYIRGKAYILNEEKPIICIGGANLDRKFHIKGDMQLGTSNPVNSTQNAGGVARNVSENLGRMGRDVILLTVSGNDSEWNYIETVSSPYMNTDYVNKLSNAATGSYTAVLDQDGNMTIALADMEIYEQLTPDLLQEHMPLLAQSECVVADLNLPEETLKFLTQLAENHDIPLIFIAVSAPKMQRLPKSLHALTWLITNRDESEAYLGLEIHDMEEWQHAITMWLDKGIKNVVITNGEQGVMIGNKEEGIFHLPAKKIEEVVDVTGAGDAFSAAAIHSWIETNALKDIAKAGIVNSAKTLQSAYTVRQDLSKEQLQRDMEEF